MTFLNILIYDYTQKVQFDYFFASVVALLFLLGILLLRASKASDLTRLRPGILTMIKLALLRFNPKKNKLFGRIAIGAGVLLAFMYAYSFMQIKMPGSLYKIATKTGRIENAESRNIKGIVMVSLRVSGENFSLPKDEGYIGTKKLIPGDSVTIQYYLDSNSSPTPDEKKKIVRLEVVQ